MKKIEALIEHPALPEVQEALLAAGIDEITVSEARGMTAAAPAFGRFHRGAGWGPELSRQLKVEVLAPTERADQVADCLRRAARLTPEAGLIATAGNLFITGEREASTDPAPSPAPPVTFTWKARPTLVPETWTLTVVTRGGAGVFHWIVGALTVNDLDIISAKSYRQARNTLDIIRVRPLPGGPSVPEALAGARDDLADAVSGESGLDEQLRRRFRHPDRPGAGPPRVKVDNASVLLHTVVSVSAPDTPGLLYRIVNAFHQSGYTVWKAEVQTREGRAADTFHIRDGNGRKAESAGQIDGIRAAIHTALTADRPSVGFRSR